MTPPTTSPSTTFVTAKVTTTSGQVAFPFVTEAQYVHFGFKDGGTPPGQGVEDMLNGAPVCPSDIVGCPPTILPSPTFNLGTNDGTTPPNQYGNITIHFGS